MKIAVVGSPGSGKTTLAATLAERLDVAHVELDALWHRPNWTTVSPTELVDQVAAAIDRSGWVTDGNYAVVRPLIWERADLVVWLDYPRPLVVSRVIRRSLARILMRTELWHGNRERFGRLLSLDPDDNIVLWTWTTHARTRSALAAAFEDSRWSGKELVRLRSSRQARAFLHGLGPE